MFRCHALEAGCMFPALIDRWSTMYLILVGMAHALTLVCYSSIGFKQQKEILLFDHISTNNRINSWLQRKAPSRTTGTSPLSGINTPQGNCYCLLILLRINIWGLWPHDLSRAVRKALLYWGHGHAYGSYIGTGSKYPNTEGTLFPVCPPNILLISTVGLI